ncbi:hypothetical protein AZH53_05455 [Methanomicrobiaceae archaeon CYW5]|uniref:hypothetical protein n=1 Tax=Methanovulcanius yangii TaxID=1789227 RepID=UPI0029CA0A83|nr:hypothetical protein [Methanovulcanius yangii]MBT8507858.1 hypothetical protein [Methanovulcanius yangii]
MAGFLKSIFGRKEEEPHAIELTLTEVPAWLDAREKEIHGDLDDMVLASRERAEGAIEILKVQVEGLSRLQPPADQVLSPKLRRVVEQGIPRFVTAMEKTLDVRLSTVPGEYYDDCVDIIAGTAKNMKGPGRYIATVFPKEMKEIRASLDIIGRDVNALGKRLGPARAEMDAIEAAREVAAAIEADIAEFRLMEKNEAELNVLIVREDADLAGARETLAGLMKVEEKGAADALSTEMNNLEKKEKGMKAEFEQFRSRSANVFRKAAHAAESEGDAGTGKSIGSFQASLTSLDAIDLQGIETQYLVLYPALQALMGRHEGIIKNRDEEDLFAGPDAFISPLTDLWRRWADNAAKIQDLRAELSTFTIYRRIDDAEKALHVVEVRRELDEKLLGEAKGKMDALTKEIPASVEDLGARLTAIRGGGVNVSVPFPSGS